MSRWGATRAVFRHFRYRARPHGSAQGPGGRTPRPGSGAADGLQLRRRGRHGLQPDGRRAPSRASPPPVSTSPSTSATWPTTRSIPSRPGATSSRTRETASAPTSPTRSSPAGHDLGKGPGPGQAVPHADRQVRDLPARPHGQHRHLRQGVLLRSPGGGTADAGHHDLPVDHDARRHRRTTTRRAPPTTNGSSMPSTAPGRPGSVGWPSAWPGTASPPARRAARSGSISSTCWWTSGSTSSSRATSTATPGPGSCPPGRRAPPSPSTRSIPPASPTTAPADIYMKGAGPDRRHRRDTRDRPAAHEPEGLRGRRLPGHHGFESRPHPRIHEVHGDRRADPGAVRRHHQGHLRRPVHHRRPESGRPGPATRPSSRPRRRPPPPPAATSADGAGRTRRPRPATGCWAATAPSTRSATPRSFGSPGRRLGPVGRRRRTDPVGARLLGARRQRRRQRLRRRHRLRQECPAAVLGPGEVPTSLSATPTGQGYWVFTNRGRAVPFGDARFLGDVSATGAQRARCSTRWPRRAGRGYYMVASDGGIFAFGDARFSGSMGGKTLNAPVQSLVPDADGTGYWLVASDGGIFAFDAPFKGSMGGEAAGPAGDRDGALRRRLPDGRRGRRHLQLLRPRLRRLAGRQPAGAPDRVGRRPSLTPAGAIRTSGARSGQTCCGRSERRGRQIQEALRRPRISVFVRPSRRILPAALALLLAATAFGAQGSVPAGYQVQSSNALAAGVDHETSDAGRPGPIGAGRPGRPRRRPSRRRQQP